MLTNCGDLLIDRKLSLEGLPLDLGGGRVLWVAQAGGFNREWAVLFSSLSGEPPREGEGQEERGERILGALISQTLVTRWTGFECDCHGEAPLDPEHVADLVGNSPKVRERIMVQATTEEDYRLARDLKSDP
jgi:hypothetical protein